MMINILSAWLWQTFMMYRYIFLFIYLFVYLFILLSYISSQHQFHLPPLLQIHSSSLPFRKQQAFQGHQPNVACQVIRLGTSPHFWVGQDNPVDGKGSEKQTKKSETLLPLLVTP